MPKILYLIAGANGSGKTTFAREFLKKEKVLPGDLFTMAQGNMRL